MNKPLVSICIPAYNASPFIAETISCWVSQTYQNLEIIILDDCSTDDTYEIAQTLAKDDKRIKVFKNAKNLGIGANWNETYAKAEGEYVVIANADDIYYPELLSNSLLIFNKNIDADSVSFKYLLYNESNKQDLELNVHRRLMPGKQPNLFKLCFFENPFSIVFTVFKKSSLDKLLIQNQLFLNTQICDAELFFRMGENNFNHFYSNYLAGKYRKHSTNNSYIPNGESYSWLYEVFPIYKAYLYANYKKETKILLKNKILHQFKYAIKNFRGLDIRQLNTLVKEYLYF